VSASIEASASGQHPLLQAFAQHLSLNRAALTSEAYLRDCQSLLTQLVQLGEADLSQFDDRLARKVIAQLHKQGLSGRSIARMMSAWRQWFKYLRRHQPGALPEGDPLLGLKAPKYPKRLPNALSPDEAKQLLLPDADGLSGIKLRDQALFELLYSSGMRVSELLGIELADLSLANQEVRVLGKGMKQRILPIGREALAALSQWLPERTQWLAQLSPDTAPSKALFITSKGRRLSVRRVQQSLHERGLKQGLASATHPHRLRHAFASHLLQSSGDLRAVQELMGHASIKSTQVYTHLDFQHLAQVYDAAHPRAKKA
jgi:integrase/recombinase XerC